jgi:hypothetical protein
VAYRGIPAFFFSAARLISADERLLPENRTVPTASVVKPLHHLVHYGWRSMAGHPVDDSKHLGQGRAAHHSS